MFKSRLFFPPFALKLKKNDFLFILTLQVGVPHDDNDMYDRHVLPAGHSRRPWLEHVNPAAAQSQSVCVCVWVRERARGQCNSLSSL